MSNKLFFISHYSRMIVVKIISKRCIVMIKYEKNKIYLYVLSSPTTSDFEKLFIKGPEQKSVGVEN